MNAHSDLIARARRALESAAAATLALAPLALQPAAAATIDTGDLIVTNSGAYFYNSSGYFADWRGRPDASELVAANPDGSTKLYGSATASTAQFLAHNCYTNPYPGCTWYEDRGIAMVWSGTLASPAAVGDRLAITVDFTVTLPDIGGSWSFGAQLADYNLGNYNSLPSYGTSSTMGWQSEGGTYRVHGLMVTDALYEGQVQPDAPIYWRVYVSGTANAPWSETYWSDTYQSYVTPHRPVTITVPDHSIDVAHVDANYVPSGDIGLTVTAVPEPGTWLTMLLGVGILAARIRQRG
jgi:hypothetical protein